MQEKRSWGGFIVALIILYPTAQTGGGAFDDFAMASYFAGAIGGYFFFYWLKGKLGVIKDTEIKAFVSGLLTWILFAFACPLIALIFRGLVV